MICDASTKTNYHKVVQMMCKISKDWFEDYRDNLESWPADEQETIKLFLRPYKVVIDKIDTVLAFDKKTSKGRDFYEDLRAVQDSLGMFGPIVKYPKRPRFALNDFIARWLRSFEFCIF